MFGEPVEMLKMEEHVAEKDKDEEGASPDDHCRVEVHPEYFNAPLLIVRSRLQVAGRLG